MRLDFRNTQGIRARVSLDSQELPESDVLMADDAAGEVEVLSRGENGKLIESPKDGSAQRETRKGKVEIRVTTPAPEEQAAEEPTARRGKKSAAETT